MSLGFTEWLLVALVVFFLLLGGWGLMVYNRLVRARNQLREGWSGVDVQLKMRHDLVPALVDCVKGYQTHERSVLEAVTQFRGGSVEDVEGEKQFSRDLGRVVALAEAYPDLKADEQFLKLMKELIKVEDQLQYARRYYNGSVRDLNNLVESFPSNLVAKLGGFQTTAFYEVEQATDRLAPDLAKQLRNS